MDPTKTILGLLTPVVAAGSAWLCAVAAKHGMNLDPSGVNALAVAGLTAGGAVGLKLIHDLERSRQAQATIAAAKSVDASLVAADPKANQQLEDLAAQIYKAAQAKADAAAQIPQPAPTPVEPPA